MIETLLHLLINLLKIKFKENGMSGWKTWLAGVGAIVYGVILIVGGHQNEGITLILSGLAALGIGHKIEKAGKF